MQQDSVLVVGATALVAVAGRFAVAVLVAAAGRFAVAVLVVAAAGRFAFLSLVLASAVRKFPLVFLAAVGTSPAVEAAEPLRLLGLLLKLSS